MASSSSSSPCLLELAAASLSERGHRCHHQTLQRPEILGPGFFLLLYYCYYWGWW
jgi:hypothetical protein